MSKHLCPLALLAFYSLVSLAASAQEFDVDEADSMNFESFHVTTHPLAINFPR